MGSVSSYLPLAEDYVFYIHSIFSLAVSMNREKKMHWIINGWSTEFNYCPKCFCAFHFFVFKWSKLWFWSALAFTCHILNERWNLQYLNHELFPEQIQISLTCCYANRFQLIFMERCWTWKKLEYSMSLKFYVFSSRVR